MKAPRSSSRAVPRQAKIAMAGLLGVGVLGVTAYLLIGQPQPQGTPTELVSVSAPGSAGKAAPAGPTVRTQAPLSIPDLPFLVSAPASSSTSTTPSGTQTGSATQLTPRGSGLKNPFRPFRVKPKEPAAPTDPLPPAVTPSFESSPTPLPEPVVVRPVTPTPSNTLVTRPPTAPSNTPTVLAPVIPIPTPPSAPNPAPSGSSTPKTPRTVRPPSASPIRITPVRPAPVVRIVTPTPPLVQPTPSRTPPPSSTPVATAAPAPRPIPPTPIPTARVQSSSTPVTLPSSLAQGTLPVLPPVLSQTLNAPTEALEDPATPILNSIPDGASGTPSEAGDEGVSLPETASGMAGTQGVPDTLDGSAALITPDQKLLPDAPPPPSPLETLVLERGLSFSSVVLGPVNTAIFQTKTGPVVVPLGQTLPDSSAVVQSVTATSAILQLGEQTLELTLDRR